MAGASEPDPEGDFEFDSDGLGLSNDTICSTDISCAGPCPAGYYCPDEGTLLPLCPAGHYRSETGGKCGDEADCLALIELDDTVTIDDGSTKC